VAALAVRAGAAVPRYGRRMLAVLAIISVLACGEEPAPEAAPAPVAEAPAAPTSPPKAAKAKRKAVPSTAPPLEEADRPVSAEVQAAIDLLNGDDAVGARAALDTWVAAHPDDLDARYWRAKTELQTMAWAEAEADAMIVVEAVPGWVNPKVLLGGALAMQRRCEEALPHLEQVVALMPEHHIGYMNRGSCRYRVGDVDGSIEDAKKACALGNDRACRTAPKLERRKIWKENLKRKAAEKAAAAEAAAAEAAGGELAAPPDADGAHEDGPHGDAAKGEPAAPAGAPGAP
jgi:Tfp pilus assembly protein PilF